MSKNGKRGSKDRERVERPCVPGCLCAGGCGFAAVYCEHCGAVDLRRTAEANRIDENSMAAVDNLRASLRRHLPGVALVVIGSAKHAKARGALA